MTTQEKIEVMKAYTEGKQIQLKILGNWKDWHDGQDPEWNWEANEYRIKPESTYRPYRNTAELIEDYLRRNGRPSDGIYMPMIWVKNDDGFTTLIVEFGPNHVWRSVVHEGVSMSKLFQDYTYLDGSPCGVKEE